MSGKKIIDGLKDAIAGNFSAVTIEGQRWVRADEIERLRERCEAYKGQVKAGAEEIERLHKVIMQMARDSDAEFARLTGVAFDIRTATIEECAQIADEHSSAAGERIRALKEQK